MEQQISIRGRTARHMVRLANHFPVIGAKAQSGELRKKLNEREKKWECPEHLKCTVIQGEHCNMELLSSRQGRQFGVILQLHGGGYYGRLHNTYRDMAALYNEISKGLDVLSVDYRVAPEYPFPAALEDAVAAYRWILAKGYDTGKA